MAEYRVYVIRLSSDVKKSKKFRQQNPKMLPGKACYYVGSTGMQSLEARFIKHLEGGRTSSYTVFQHGMSISRKYTPKTGHNTRKAAEKAEKKLALALRRAGHGVYFNANPFHTSV